MPVAPLTPLRCALCQSLVEPGGFTLEPLGRDDRMVRVCARCSTETHRSREVDRGYTTDQCDQLGSGGGMGYRSMVGKGNVKPELAPRRGTSFNNHLLDDFDGDSAELARRRPGARLHLLAKVDPRSRKNRTLEEAMAIAARMPWGDDVEYLTWDSRFFIFQEVT